MKVKSKSIKTVFLIALLAIIACSKKSDSKKIEIIKLAETSQSWNGDSLPNYLEGTPKVTVLKITIPPKTKLKWHKHLVINSGVLTKGALTVVDEDGNKLFLKEGEAIVELVNKYHFGENEANEPAEIIVFYAGNIDVPITVLKNPKEAH